MATVREIKGWPEDRGWYTSPSGQRLHLGKRVRLGDRVSLGDRVKLGDGVRLEKPEDVITMGPIGSRRANLLAYRVKREIYLSTGCVCLGLKEFAAKVAAKYPEGEAHRRSYDNAIEFVQNYFQPEKKGPVNRDEPNGD